jgi:uncharacterized protein (DUF427 family)
VSVNGEVVAETNRPKILFETGLPPRYYIPPEDVLAASETTTQCPYKGVASYYSVEAGGSGSRTSSGTTRTPYPRRPR